MQKNYVEGGRERESVCVCWYGYACACTCECVCLCVNIITLLCFSDPSLSPSLSLSFLLRLFVCENLGRPVLWQPYLTWSESVLVRMSFIIHEERESLCVDCVLFEWSNLSSSVLCYPSCELAAMMLDFS